MPRSGRKISSRVAAAFALVLLAALFAGAQDGGFSIDRSPLPEPTGFVNDFAGVIDEASKAQIEAKLKNLRDTTSPSVEIGVAIVHTTGDRPISDYSLAVARGWKIGSKEDDNPSALLFIAVDDRKYFTQISRNLEDELPDATVGTLQRQYLVPEFRKGNYAKGISDTIDAYIARIRETGNAPVNANANADVPRRSTGGAGIASGGVGSFTCCLAILIILIVLAVSRLGRRRSSSDANRWGGGGFGGGGLGGSALPWIIGSVISSAANSSGGSSGWGSSSSSDSGGGSDWGGFGGGGDFGGGGSGGDW